MNDNLENIIKAIFEARYLKRIKRSGTSILLGSQIKESIPEHSFYVSLFGILMKHINPMLDLGKLLTMCIIHDVEEVRTGDLHQVNRLYYKVDPELMAFSDMWKGSKLGEKLTDIHTERHESKSSEAMASYDCDTLAELILEKEYLNQGTKEAKEWMEFTIQRLKTAEGKRIAEVIVKERSTKWWEEVKNQIRKMHNLPPKKYE
ncbi:hypothetical protein A2863_04460 [Candidatus Woesebacteria bacterium RIFCSPHIGHO2_01_FULL_38_9b]|uniref:HD domain-containing protein n=1 Tax=Candidatus Woesebacteria bacterium RIFCSPHIGHO2_01_FULL_38_9b TaxID=1802493 RepID=A0A1F7Y118_9BACT|nr:MAG: hypothetical protein A2863_04460 [Candidatus Woesebacteria bacterium RIFCSPHIGHO2_01_FULL_38_9b]